MPEGERGTIRPKRTNMYAAAGTAGKLPSVWTQPTGEIPNNIIISLFKHLRANIDGPFFRHTGAGSDNRQLDVDVVTGSVRIGAVLMGSLDQPLCILAADTRQADLKIRCDAKPAL